MQNLKVFVVLGALAYALSMLVAPPVYISPSTSAAALSEAATQEGQKPPEPPELPQLLAASVVIFDPLHRAYLLEQEADKPLGIASISKIMTALVAYERTNNDDLVAISREAILTEGTSGDLAPGEHFRTKDLLRLMLMESSNDAAAAIAEHIGRIYGAENFSEASDVFAGLMNEKAASLGMTNTMFQNATGLDIDPQTPSNISTAHDIVKLALYSLRYPGIWETTDRSSETITSQEGTTYTVHNINTLASELPGFIGGKTGFTDIAGGSLLVIIEVPIGSPKIVLVLGSTHDGRFLDVQNLVDWLKKGLL